MAAPLENYLRTYRRRSRFSQEDVALLLGSRSGTKVCRYEQRVRKPTLEIALAYEAIFQVPVSALFAGLYRKVEKEIIARAEDLAERLVSANTVRVSSHKLAALRAISTRQPASPTKR